MRCAALLLLVSSVALASPAEVERLLSEMDKLAQKGAWSGVERVWGEIQALQGEVPAESWLLAAQSAAQRGEAGDAYRRYLTAERMKPGITAGSMDQYRTDYGRLEVRRVEATCAVLAAAERPFEPQKALAVDRAAQVLAETGGFSGMVPAGAYLVAGQSVQVAAGAAPTVVQRRAGDGDCPRKR
jgi:hypothetical protein